MRVAFCLMALASVAAPAVARDSIDQQPVKERKICRAGELATGSIMPKRVCRTKEEWAALEEAHKAETERYLLNANRR
jgi:hypothetical protein